MAGTVAAPAAGDPACRPPDQPQPTARTAHTGRIRAVALDMRGDGGTSKPADVAAALERMRAALPGLRTCELLPGAGHWLQQERPTEVSASLVAFSTSLPGRRTQTDG